MRFGTRIALADRDCSYEHVHQLSLARAYVDRNHKVLL